jgi:hypothetical protein
VQADYEERQAHQSGRITFKQRESTDALKQRAGQRGERSTMVATGASYGSKRRRPGPPSAPHSLQGQGGQGQHAAQASTALKRTKLSFGDSEDEQGDSDTG